MSCRYPAKCSGQVCILKGCLKWTVLHEVYFYDETPYRWVHITHHLFKEMPEWILKDTISAAFLTVAPSFYFHITCNVLTCYMIFPNRKAPAILMTSSPHLHQYNNFHQPTFMTPLMHFSGPGSIVGIATGYGLDGSGIESWWGRDYPHLSRPALGPTQPPAR
jgi:hypothetical protein